tara:strand:+ start:611 stop:787 length:177 start_codon:yes stop_codon:yes gene_type:complete
MTIITKGMGAILKGKKAKKATGQKRIDEINKKIFKSTKKQDVTEKYIDEVKSIYDKNK